MSETSFWDKLNPRVHKNWFYFMGGLVWTGVGILLWSWAFYWLSMFSTTVLITYGATGIILGLIVYKLGFFKVAFKNIKRICEMKERNCIFAFQKWKSYILVVFMIALGITLRHSSIPKNYLAIVYLTMGGALLFSSFHFYKVLRHVRLNGNTCPEYIK